MLPRRCLAVRKPPGARGAARRARGWTRAAAQKAFSEFLSNRSLTTPQIRFIEMGDPTNLRHGGVMEPSALYEAPFSGVHAGGPRRCSPERAT